MSTPPLDACHHPPSRDAWSSKLHDRDARPGPVSLCAIFGVIQPSTLLCTSSLLRNSWQMESSLLAMLSMPCSELPQARDPRRAGSGVGQRSAYGIPAIVYRIFFRAVLSYNLQCDINHSLIFRPLVSYYESFVTSVCLFLFSFLADFSFPFSRLELIRTNTSFTSRANIKSPPSSAITTSCLSSSPRFLHHSCSSFHQRRLHRSGVAAPFHFL